MTTTIHPLVSPWGRFGLVSFFVDAPEPAIVDTGVASSPEAIRAALAVLGRDVADVRWILHTHGHIDHVGGTYALWEATGRRARVAIHAADADLLRSRRGIIAKNLAIGARYAPHPTLEADQLAQANAVISGELEPDLLLQGGEELDLGGVPAVGGTVDGQLVARNDGSFAVVEDGGEVPINVPKTQTGEVRALLQLRDQARALISAEAATLDDTAALDTARDQLATSWRTYVNTWGPINRYTLRSTGRVDPDTGEAIQSRVTPPAVRLVTRSTFGTVVAALEVFDDLTQTAEPASLLRHRLIVPRQPIQGVETAADGLAVVLDSVGRVDIDEIARLMGAGVTRRSPSWATRCFRCPVRARIGRPAPTTCPATSGRSSRPPRLRRRPSRAGGRGRSPPWSESSLIRSAPATSPPGSARCGSRTPTTNGSWRSC